MKTVIDRDWIQGEKGKTIKVRMEKSETCRHGNEVLSLGKAKQWCQRRSGVCWGTWVQLSAWMCEIITSRENCVPAPKLLLHNRLYRTRI